MQMQRLYTDHEAQTGLFSLQQKRGGRVRQGLTLGIDWDRTDYQKDGFIKYSSISPDEKRGIFAGWNYA